MITAGLIKRRIQIDEPVNDQNETGEIEQTFEEFAEVWASIEPLKGREALLNGVNASQTDTRIRIRWSPNVDIVTTEYRIRYKSTIYDIVSLIHINTGRREIEILAKSGVSDG